MDEEPHGELEQAEKEGVDTEAEGRFWAYMREIEDCFLLSEDGVDKSAENARDVAADTDHNPGNDGYDGNDIKADGSRVILAEEKD